MKHTRRYLSSAALLLAGTMALSACSNDVVERNSAANTTADPRAGKIEFVGAEPDVGYTPLLETINGATQSVDMVIYQLGDPKVQGALKDAQARGVDVRVLMTWQTFPDSSSYDPKSKKYNRNTDAFNDLEAAGIDVAWSRQEFPYTHQKSVVADAGTDSGVALITDYNYQPGYFGVIDPKYPNEGGTRGFNIKMSDPAIVAEMTRVFDADFPPFSVGSPYSVPDLVWSPTTPQFEGEAPGNSGTVLPALIESAQQTLDVYMLMSDPNNPQLAQLIQAARRGVNVRVLTNCGRFVADTDVQNLRDAGAEIQFDPTSPLGADKSLFIHTKSLIADYNTNAAVSYVGSENIFLEQSLAQLREAGIILRDSDTIKPINQTFATDWATSSPECSQGNAKTNDQLAKRLGMLR